MIIHVFDIVENIMGKGENAGYQHFLFFPGCCSESFFNRVTKSHDCVEKSNNTKPHPHPFYQSLVHSFCLCFQAYVNFLSEAMSTEYTRYGVDVQVNIHLT